MYEGPEIVEQKQMKPTVFCLISHILKGPLSLGLGQLSRKEIVVIRILLNDSIQLEKYMYQDILP